MPKRIKYSAEEKYEILKAYENGAGSLAEIASTYKIGIQTIFDWRYLFEKYGIEGLSVSKVFKHYSEELKEQAVNDFLSGTYSKRQIVHKYEISSISVLNKWINRHNGHRGLIVNGKGMGQSMTYGRPTSWKERIEIVQFCIAHNNDYQKTIDTYLVSYSQLYRWIKKYELDGAEALKDRRGQKKDTEQLSSEDKIKLVMKKLEAENMRLKAENAFLKKLEQLERGLC